MSFFSSLAELKMGKGNKLIRLLKLIDWQKIAKRLSKVYGDKHKGVAGVKPYSSLSMFKALLLQSWHSLSDPGLEEALRVRLDFMEFTGFSLEDQVPDETTICRFRNRLVKLGLDKELFDEINQQLSGYGFAIKKAQGAVVDATVIESAARPKRQIEVAEDREESKTESSNLKMSESVDPDSKWLKKGKKFFFGYKLFLSVDPLRGFIQGLDLAGANRSECAHLKEFIDKMGYNEGTEIYTDKGYASKDNRDILKEKKLKDKIMHKKSKGKDLTKKQRLMNNEISKKRYIVEQANGTLKRIFGFRKASYFQQRKVEAQALFKSMCFNLNKALNYLGFLEPSCPMISC